MDPFFVFVEQSALSRWVVGDAFLYILVVHTIGVAMVAGPNAAIALRMLGVARAAPLPSLLGFFPVMWIGLAANVPSGVLLLIGYPTKALTNPVFYVKLLAIGLGLALALHIRRTLLLPSSPEPSAGASARIKATAWASLTLWAVAIAAGRLLAYTYGRLTAAG